MSVKWKTPADNGGSDIIYFTLYRDDGNGGPLVPIYQRAALSYENVNLKAYRSYRFQVSATNAQGESELSDTA